jgi:phage tail sheath protein FI
MPMYRHPGVYIEHVPSGLLAIEAASTSVAAFVGPVRRGPVGEPVFVTSASLFAQQFGALTGGSGGIRDNGDSVDKFGHAVNAFFSNGGTKAYIVRVAENGTGLNVLKAATAVMANPEDPAKGFVLTAKSPGAWANAMMARLRTTDATAAPAVPDTELGYTLQLGVFVDGSFQVLESFPGLQMAATDAQSIENVVTSRSTLASIEAFNVPGEIQISSKALQGVPMVLALPLTGKKIEIKIGNNAQFPVEFVADSNDPAAIAAFIRQAARADPLGSPTFEVTVTGVSPNQALRLSSGIANAAGDVSVPAGDARTLLGLGGDATQIPEANTAKALQGAAMVLAPKKLALAGKKIEIKIGDNDKFPIEFVEDSDDPKAIADVIRKAAREHPLGSPDFEVAVTGTAPHQALRLSSGIAGAAGDVSVPAGNARSALGLVGIGVTQDDVTDSTLPSGSSTLEAFFDGGSDGDTTPATAAYTAVFETLRDYRDISIILLPGLEWDEGGDNSVIEAAITHSEFMQNRMVIVDPPEPVGTDTLVSPKDVKDLGAPTSPYTALYYPWLRVANPFYDPDTAANKPKTFSMPPSSFAAGMWARIDGSRGVWKAPAGLEATVRGAIGPTLLIGNDLQDNLNDLGINCLRAIVGPTVIWGARTLATKVKPEFRYIPVRRTQNMIGESLYSALQAVVFEPNDHRLWASLRASVGTFMDGLFRAGAFQGAKASEAYYVQCGLGSTMTQGDVDAGIVRVVVGFAPLKPAEFVVVQIKQIVGQTA